MSETARALEDIKNAFAAKDEGVRERTLDKITDLFMVGAPQFSENHVALFDQVIGILADAIEIRARARLSERLADLPNAPVGVIRKLSRDDIVVARPVLTRSLRLTEKDLIDAALHGGRDHMLAISERPDLPEPVTDILVSEGERVVVHAVASNPTARFSVRGFDALMTKCDSDELLQAALGRRTDIPQRHLAALFEMAKTSARARLQGDAGQRLVAKAINDSARDIAEEAAARSLAYRKAVQEVSNLVQQDGLNEALLYDYARRNHNDHVVIALSYLSKVPLPMVERAVVSEETDALLIISRSVNLGWTTVRAIFAMRSRYKPSHRQLEQLAESYGKLSPSTAQRVLRFLHARESAVAAMA